jgi:hypothetical protein
VNASGVTVLADSDTGKGSPIGFFVVLVLVIAVYFLYRSMNRHLKKVPDSFEPPPPVGEPDDPRQLLGEQRPAQPPTGEDASVNPREPGPDRP